MKTTKLSLVVLSTAVLSLTTIPQAHAGDLYIDMNIINAKGIGQSIGSVKVSQSAYGLVFTPKLTTLSSGLHGFHLHQNADCGNVVGDDGKVRVGLAAGGHYDPKGAKKHDKPWADGHLGDLPAVYFDANNQANQPVLAPRLTMADLQGRSLMIHEGGDNFSDHPHKLGGGGGRMACGVVK